MKLIPPTKSAGQKAVQPTKRGPKRGKARFKARAVPAKAAPALQDSAPAADAAEPAAQYMAAASRKSKASVI